MRLVIVLSAWTLLPGAIAQEKPSPSPGVTEGDVSARSKALELAGAFSNDGYKIRDGYWPGEIEPNRSQLLEVNLFAGNEYWFSAAVNLPGRKIAVSVLNEKGKPVDYQTYEDEQVAAAGFLPEVSGRYYVKVTMLEGDKAQFCLLYSYK
ncbi:MAG TPA: hypothetical protein VIS99_14075 [Terrimicrobiaceae bacterium]